MLQVLIASESEEVRDKVRWVLRTVGGYAVVAEAHHGAEAVSLTDQHRPDLVVLDLEMHDLNGLEATPLVRARVPEAAIVVLTPGHTEIGGRAAVRLGADDHIPKARLVVGLLSKARRLVDTHLTWRRQAWKRQSAGRREMPALRVYRM